MSLNKKLSNLNKREIKKDWKKMSRASGNCGLIPKGLISVIGISEEDEKDCGTEKIFE